MQIDLRLAGTLAVLRLKGRLDVSWADHFSSRAGDVMRSGYHHLRIDAAGVDYISSAGLRSLIHLHKELAAVNGSCYVIRASGFVENALRMSGMDWMLNAPQEEVQLADEAEVDEVRSAATATGVDSDVIVLDPSAIMTLTAPCTWSPWQFVEAGDLALLSFPQDTLALGIGGPGQHRADALPLLGEFLAVGGCLTWLSSGGSSVPDYLIQADRLVPELHALQALRATGASSHLLRFRPAEAGASLTLSGLAGLAFRATGSSLVVMTCMAEIDGMVGVALARSPCELVSANEDPGAFPSVREWLAFCGDRVHARQTALVVAVAARNPPTALADYLAPMPDDPDLFLHAHAVVLPFRPLPEGRIELVETVQALFASTEPVDLLHLVKDTRPLTGLGESAFGRGACWCAPARFVKGGAL